MNRKQDMALAILTKSASLHAARLRKQAAWTDNVKDFFSNPDNQRLLTTYALPTLVGGGIGALANKRNRLLGALLGAGGGAAVGGGLHALQHYNIGGLGDWAKGLFDPNYRRIMGARKEFQNGNYEYFPGQRQDNVDATKEVLNPDTAAQGTDPAIAGDGRNMYGEPGVVPEKVPVKGSQKMPSAMDGIDMDKWNKEVAAEKARAERDAAVEQKETQDINNSVLAEQDAIAGDARLKAEQAVAKARAEQAQREQTAAEDTSAFSKEPNAAGYYDAADAARVMRSSEEAKRQDQIDELQDMARTLYRTPVTDPRYNQYIREANDYAADARALRDNGGPSPSQVLSTLITNTNEDAAGTAALNAADRAEYDARVGEANIAAARAAERRAIAREKRKAELARMDAQAKDAEEANARAFSEVAQAVPFGASEGTGMPENLQGRPARKGNDHAAFQDPQNVIKAQQVAKVYDDKARELLNYMAQTQNNDPRLMAEVNKLRRASVELRRNPHGQPHLDELAQYYQAFPENIPVDWSRFRNNRPAGMPGYTQRPINL